METGGQKIARVLQTMFAMQVPTAKAAQVALDAMAHDNDLTIDWDGFNGEVIRLSRKELTPEKIKDMIQRRTRPRRSSGNDLA